MWVSLEQPPQDQEVVVRQLFAGKAKYLLDESLGREVTAVIQGSVIAYNTWKLHQVLERSREAGQPVPSDAILAHIAPLAFRYINFQRIYRFPLERYLDRLLPSLVPFQKIAAGAK